jgi:pimeloyl-ACP methyl ester carboxylesterase
LTVARDTTGPLRALSDILAQAHPSWRVQEIPRGGHMAPLTRPRVFNAIALAFFSGV